MVFSTAELLFPHHVIHLLRDQREGDEAWKALVDSVLQLPETDENSLAFSLMMIRVAECLNCSRDSYKYQRGCKTCATQTILHYKEEREPLLEIYAQAQKDVHLYLQEHPEVLQRYQDKGET